MRFRDHKVAGDILDLAARYRDEGADELVFYDITASPEGRSVERKWIKLVARSLDIPFCVAGGIRSVADAEVLLNAGADVLVLHLAFAELAPRGYQSMGEIFGYLILTVACITCAVVLASAFDE